MSQSEFQEYLNMFSMPVYGKLSAVRELRVQEAFSKMGSNKAYVLDYIQEHFSKYNNGEFYKSQVKDLDLEVQLTIYDCLEKKISNGDKK